MADMKPGDNPAIDLAAQTAQQQASSQNTALQIHQLMDQQADADNMAMIHTLALGTADATISNEKNALQSAVDAKNAQIRLQFGADPTVQGTLSNTWLTRMNDAAEKQYQALDVIKEKQGKTLLSDPLGYINAQFTLPADIATHNYYDSQRSIAEEQLNEITSASNANVIAATNASAKTSTELAIAEAQKATENAQLGVAKLLKESAGTRIVGLDKLDSLDKNSLGLVFQLHAAQNSDKSLEQQAQNHADMMALRQERLDQKATDAESMDLDRQAYNMAQKRLGKPEVNDPKVWENIYKKNYQRNAEFMETLGQGQTLQSNGGITNGVAVAGSAGKAALLYASGGTNNLKTDPVGSFLVRQLADVKAVPGASKDPEVVAAAVTDQAIKAANVMRGQIRDDSPNIYTAPPPAVVLKAVGAASDPFLDSVVRPIAEQDPKASIPDGTIFAKGFEFSGRTAGNTNLAAEGIANYYKVAVLKNNLLNQYDEKGLPKQTNYPVVIDGKTVDATNPIEVKKAILLHNTRAAISGDASFFSMMGQPGQ